MSVSKEEPDYRNAMAHQVNQLAKAFQDKGRGRLATELKKMADNIEAKNTPPLQVWSDVGAFIKGAKSYIEYDSQDPTFKLQFTAGLKNLQAELLKTDFLSEREKSRLKAHVTQITEPLTKTIAAYGEALATRQAKTGSPELDARMKRLNVTMQAHLELAKNAPSLAEAQKAIRTASNVFDDIVRASKGKNLAQTIRAKFSTKPVADSLSVREAFKEALQKFNPSTEQSSKKFESIKKAFSGLKKPHQEKPDEAPKLKK